jgi:hypothetical protein
MESFLGTKNYQTLSIYYGYCTAHLTNLDLKIIFLFFRLRKDCTPPSKYCSDTEAYRSKADRKQFPSSQELTSIKS